MARRDTVIETLVRYTRALSVAFGFRDYPTRLHSERVSDLAVALGRRCRLSQRELGTLGIAANLHDIGKIGIPDRILMKSAPLEAGEWEKVHEHSAIGEDILMATGLEGAAEAAAAIRYHHERFDGRGYPDGLAGERIPLPSRIIGIADSYDAMAVRRVYHRARSHREIMAVLEEETGGKHDPQLMRVFCGVIERSPFRVR